MTGGTAAVLYLQYFDTVGWVFWPVKTASHITYTVLVGTQNTAQSNPIIRYDNDVRTMSMSLLQHYDDVSVVSASMSSWCRGYDVITVASLTSSLAHDDDVVVAMAASLQHSWQPSSVVCDRPHGRRLSSYIPRRRRLSTSVVVCKAMWFQRPCPGVNVPSPCPSVCSSVPACFSMTTMTHVILLFRKWQMPSKQ